MEEHEVASGAGPMTTTPPETVAPRRTFLPRPADRLALGAGLKVSPLCLGLVQDPRTVLEAYDRGINFFFLTADLHWPLYDPLRQGLARLFARGGGVRDEVVVCTTSYVSQPRFSPGAFEEARLSVPGLQRLDVLVAGACYSPDYPLRLAAQRQLFVPRAFGCRAHGFSFHERPLARRALVEDGVDLGFVRYNPAHPRAQTDLFPDLLGRRRGLCYVFKSTHGHRDPALLEKLGLGDYWLPRKADHYRFALTAAAVDGLLFAPPTPADLHQALDALQEGALDPDEEEHLVALAAPPAPAPSGRQEGRAAGDGRDQRTDVQSGGPERGDDLGQAGKS
jgi:hypothetical protein